MEQLDLFHASAIMDAASRTPQPARRDDQRRLTQFGLDCTAGVLAFLLSSTIAVSCATVVTGHGTPLSDYVSHFIDMNFLGTALLTLFLAWQITAPWVLGGIDVFVYVFKIKFRG